MYRATGRESLTARGKLHLLRTELANTPSAVFEDLFAQCLLCGACENVCPRELPIRRLIIESRSHFSSFYGRHGLQKSLARQALSRTILLEGLVKAGIALENLSLIPKDSGLRIKLGLLEKNAGPEPDKKQQRETGKFHFSSAVSYFTGCVARYLQPSIAEATRRLACGPGGNIPYEPQDQMCCGLAAWSAGKKEEAKRLAKMNIEAFALTSGPILTSCASCSAHLMLYPEFFPDDTRWQEKAEQFSSRVKEFSSFMLEQKGEKAFRAFDRPRVFYHEPCHLRFDRKNREAPRTLLQMVDNAIFVETEEGQHCCGQGGLFHLGYPELADRIFSTAYDACHKVNPGIVVTSCSSC
ncbi:MAG: (Fe-S)-binding protein, partial [Desulfobulbales bacterium]